MSAQPLNLPLFRQLQARFGNVRINNAGQRRIVDYAPDPSRPGRMRAHTRVYGEQYSCNCPFCGDQRHRLSLSYLYGEFDPVTHSSNHGLWRCFNENCQRNPANSDRLRSYTAMPFGTRPIQQVAVATSDTTEPPRTPDAMSSFPTCISVDQLPAGHPAIAYLQSRGFDAFELAQAWQISYCEYSATSSYLTQNRLIIPIFGYGTQVFAPHPHPSQLIMAGWQARKIDETFDSRPKYFSCPGMEKSKLLYGLHMAMGRSGPVWLCEGVTDCWRVGPGAVAILGKVLSEYQLRVIVHHFPGRPIAVLLDRDARIDAEQIRIRLQRARCMSNGDRRVVLVELPSGRNDPGECTSAEILVATQTALGVSVSRAPAAPYNPAPQA